ncbi:26S proteasome subunit P45 [Lanmaoa asiatica]|nr:26S proteasome subunit P45 [Lanmaoa asiatica]
MSSAPPPPPEIPPQGKQPESQSDTAPQSAQDATAMDTTPDHPPEETWDDIPADILSLSTDEILTRIRLIENDIKVMKSETLRLQHEQSVMKEKIRDNGEKIKQNKVLPYLVGNVVEVILPSSTLTFSLSSLSTQILDVDPESEEDGANQDLDSMRKGKCAVVKTSTRQTVFLPLIGLVPPEQLKPSDLVGVNKDSYLILDKLPTEFDSRVKAMEVDERPTETYTDIGGLEKQIEELVEAIVLPMEQADKFKTLGIKPPKGCLMYGPPGTGKTLLARACAAQTKACYLKLAGPSLVQMFIGDGAKLVRDAFELAKEKAPAIIFIDELDAIGTKRFDSEKSGDREVQRTMLELLNQLDVSSFAKHLMLNSRIIQVIAATNRIDILDPALLRSGRLDRKIEFPLPNETARARILEIHSRKMTVSPDVNFEELARSTDEFNGAQLKATCVEAGMIALREGATKLTHEHFLSGIAEGKFSSSGFAAATDTLL